MAITGSIQEKNGRYYTVINMPLENGRTKAVWKSTGLPVRGNKKQAVKILNDKLTELNKSCLVYTKLTVAEYFTQWLDLIKTEVRPNTYRSYYGNMTNHIIPYFESKNIQLQDLKPYHLENYYKSRQQPNSKTGSSEALSPTTIKHHHQNISKALSDALRRGLIIANPASSARTPKAEKHKGEFLDVNQIKELLILFKGNTVEIPVVLCAVYGLRRSEALGLKWSHVDFKRRTITIAETLQQHTGGDYQDKPKTESSYRTLPMLDSVYDMLMAQRKIQSERAAIMGNYYVSSDFVCTWSDGKVITPNYLTRTFHAVISRSSLPQIRLHDLRHSVASNLLSSGMNVVDVQEWLGHANASTTLDIYSHAANTSKTTIAKTLSSLVFTE